MSPLVPSDFLPDPVAQFRSWYEPLLSSGRENFNAVALSTASVTGRVSSRMVLLKSFDEEGFVFFTNYGSKKGNHLNTNPSAAMLFYWPEMGRQVRIEGLVVKTGFGESDRYFASRTEGHKINAWASEQSNEIDDMEDLYSAARRVKENFSGGDIPRPSYWGGYRLMPDLFEFWQEGKERFHERIEYNNEGGGWSVRRLSP